MDVADVAAEVLHRLLGRFAHVAVRVVHIPKGRDALCSSRCRAAFQPLRIGIDAVRLDEQRDAETLGDDAEHVEHVGDVVVVDLTLRLGCRSPSYADVRRAELCASTMYCVISTMFWLWFSFSFRPQPEAKQGISRPSSFSFFTVSGSWLSVNGLAFTAKISSP